ncbi:hypothetical protein Glove_454g7 [Diversispora epigaea]|uniref:Uncharacterized protein n=1 Tax=Diversispora epigaea TaxID=1348612 RepID=A0A397GY26_9GLOM|nr:hypothetical protein Glove_454g7 [Diversispora epigaea]
MFPLIRYFHISAKDIWEKLKIFLACNFGLHQQLVFLNQPVKSLVLPARIISNPESPRRVNELISTIINEERVAEISSWIDRKSTIYSLENVPYWDNSMKFLWKQMIALYFIEKWEYSKFNSQKNKQLCSSEYYYRYEKSIRTTDEGTKTPYFRSLL